MMLSKLFSAMIDAGKERSIISDKSWGLPAGPLPLIIKQEPKPVEQWICPHCNKVIGEKSVFMDINNNNQYHRECGGQFVHELSPDEKDTIESLKNTWAVSEGYFGYFDDPDVAYRTEKPLPLINKSIITEAMHKGVAERIYRRTRIKKGDGTVRPKPVIKKSANNSPKQTATGRASLKGSRKKNRDKRQKECMESIDFIRRFYKQPIDVVIENISRLNDPIGALNILEGLLNHNIDKQWVNNTVNAIKTVLESYEYHSTPYFAIASIDESVNKTKIIVNEDLDRVKQYFPNACVEQTVSNNLAKFTIVVKGEFNNAVIIDKV